MGRGKCKVVLKSHGWGVRKEIVRKGTEVKRYKCVRQTKMLEERIPLSGISTETRRIVQE